MLIKNFFGLAEMTFGLVCASYRLPDRMASCKTDFLCTLLPSLYKSLVLKVTSLSLPRCAKRVVSDSPGLVDFAIGLANFVLNLPDG